MQTDNAWTYIHNSSLAEFLARNGIQHRRIPPRTPKRNGKVERYQQTLAREWAYGQRYRSSDARAAALPIWLIHYNTTRNHSSIGNRPPITRVSQPTFSRFSAAVVDRLPVTLLAGPRKPRQALSVHLQQISRARPVEATDLLSLRRRPS